MPLEAVISCGTLFLATGFALFAVALDPQKIYFGVAQDLPRATFVGLLTYVWVTSILLIRPFMAIRLSLSLVIASQWALLLTIG